MLSASFKVKRLILALTEPSMWPFLNISNWGCSVTTAEVTNLELPLRTRADGDENAALIFKDLACCFYRRLARDRPRLGNVIHHAASYSLLRTAERSVILTTAFSIGLIYQKIDAALVLHCHSLCLTHTHTYTRTLIGQHNTVIGAHSWAVTWK